MKRITRVIYALTAAAFICAECRVQANAGATTPFTSIEAESGTLAGGAQVQSLISAPTTQYSSPQLEASGHAFVQLTATGQSVTWTNTTSQSFTALNVRYCIPDAPSGGGITATLNLYVDGSFRQALNLNSMQTWLYENSTNYNGNDQNPADGSPRVFYDDVHTFIAGAAVAPGSRITLQKDSTNNAAFYYIDVIDLETPPAPLSQPSNSLSITSYGAMAGDTNADNSTAIQNCINNAQSQGKSVWIPQGTFYVKTQGGLNANGITIQGAGMWYSIIYRKMPIPNGTPLGAIFNLTSCTVRNFALDANATSRASVDGCGGAMDTTGVRWLADSIWTQHTMSGFWASGIGGTVQNCRLTSIWADGINLNNVSLNATVGINLTNRNNFVRGTGDDANAINSVNYNGTQYYTPMQNIVIMNTTAIAPWGGKGVVIYGGSNHLVMNNFMSDTARYVGLGVMKFGVNGSDLWSAKVMGNTVLRCGGNGYLQQQQAMMIGNGGDGQGVGTVANAYCASNTLINSLYDAVGFSTSTNIVFQYNQIIAPGLDGIAVGPAALGSGVVGTAVINSNSVTGLNAGRVAFTNGANGYASIVPIAAASFTASSGVTTESCSEGGLDLTGIGSGDWAAYDSVNLNGVDSFVARVASAGVGGNLEIHLASPTGPLLGICQVPGTGGSQNFVDAFCNLTNANGIQSVYLVFAGSGSNLFNVEWFGFYAAPPGFSHQLLAGNTYTLKSAANVNYVSATNNGNYTLAANGASPALPGQFQIVDAGGGNIGLLAVVNTNYVSADNNGNNPLIANRTAVGSWETFTEMDAGNGNIGLRAMVNGKFVTVSNGSGTLIAKSTSIGTAESFTVQFVSGVPPATPAGLAAASGNKQAALNWGVSPGATGYNLKRSTTYGGAYSVIASNLPGISYADINLANATTFYYAVSALNPAGESTNSLPVTVVVGALSRFGWLAAASSTESSGSPANAIDSNINTRWSTGAQQSNGQWFQVDMGVANTFNGLVLDAGSSSSDYPRGYQVNVSSDEVNWGSSVATGAGNSAVTTIAFLPQAARYIRVTQTGTASGLWWSIHEFNVLGTGPATPSSLAAVSVSGSQINLSWNPSTGATGYNLKRAMKSGGPYTALALNLSDTTYPDAGLSGGTLYYYIVTATNAFGESPISNEASARPISTTVPQLGLAISAGQLQLSWPVDHTGWRLEMQTNGFGTDWTTVVSSTGTNTLFLPINPANTSAFFRLAYP